jgi:CRP-like cAMP-binding protein
LAGALATIVATIVTAFLSLVLKALAQVLDAVLKVIPLPLVQAIATVTVVQPVELLGLTRQLLRFAVRNQAPVPHLVDPLFELVDLPLDTLALIAITAARLRGSRRRCQSRKKNR